MKAVILAAGYNRRLKDIIDIPKTLLKIGDATILERQINALKDAGLKDSEIFVVAGYKAEMIKAVHNNIIMNDKYVEYDNAYSVFLALDKFCNETDIKSEEILVFDGDLIYDTELIKKIISSDKKNMMVTKPIEYAPDLKDEIMVVDESTSEIKEMIIPVKGTVFDEQYKGKKLFSYIGILKISGENIRNLRDGLNNPEILKAWYTIPLVEIANNGDFYNLVIPKSLKFCFDIDNKEDLEKLKNMVV